MTLAEAGLKVAERHAEAQKREAEGKEAELAAPGLASARVMIASADAQLKQGAAQAEATRLRIAAEAAGAEQMGLAQAAVKTADAAATATHGDAEAKVIEARFEAESKGLKQKFEAMAAMSGETRAHEEFRMQLEISNQQINKGIDAQTLIAKDQAEVLGKALQNAKIDIVGGEGDYFDRFVKALSIGKGIDATVEKSRTLQVGLKDHLSGERDMVGDVRGLLGALGSSSGELQNLTVSALLARISSEGTSAQQQALQQLLASFQPALSGPRP